MKIDGLFFGDYDFNDLVVYYHYAFFIDDQNHIRTMDITFKVISTGATFDNSFAIRLPFDPSLISGISGQHFSKNVFNTNSIGFEPDGDGIVLPIFDSTLNLFGKFINVFPDESFYSPVLLTVSLDLEPGIDAITSLKPPYDRLPIF